MRTTCPTAQTMFASTMQLNMVQIIIAYVTSEKSGAFTPWFVVLTKIATHHVNVVLFAEMIEIRQVPGF